MTSAYQSLGFSPFERGACGAELLMCLEVRSLAAELGRLDR
jgi:hypothetical protein